MIRLKMIRLLNFKDLFFSGIMNFKKTCNLQPKENLTFTVGEKIMNIYFDHEKGI